MVLLQVSSITNWRVCISLALSLVRRRSLLRLLPFPSTLLDCHHVTLRNPFTFLTSQHGRAHPRHFTPLGSKLPLEEARPSDCNSSRPPFTRCSTTRHQTRIASGRCRVGVWLGRPHRLLATRWSVCFAFHHAPITNRCSLARRDAQMSSIPPDNGNELTCLATIYRRGHLLPLLVPSYAPSYRLRRRSRARHDLTLAPLLLSTRHSPCTAVRTVGTTGQAL